VARHKGFDGAIVDSRVVELILEVPLITQRPGASDLFAGDALGDPSDEANRVGRVGGRRGFRIRHERVPEARWGRCGHRRRRYIGLAIMASVRAVSRTEQDSRTSGGFRVRHADQRDASGRVRSVYEIASSLLAMGLRAGDHVGTLGWAYDAYW